jgi:hypothetical protein
MSHNWLHTPDCKVLNEMEDAQCGGCSNLRVVTEVARSLEFSDQVADLADRVIHGMTMGGKNEYNAVHLRIEKDARDWSQIMGGEQVLPHHMLLAAVYM